MLTAYFDESGKEPSQSKFLTIAGYISNITRWEAFELEWKRMLADYSLDFAHQVDFAHFKGGYKDWGESKRVAYQQDAHSIIKAHTAEKGFDASLLWDDYLAEVPSYVPDPKHPAYAILVNAIMLNVGQWLNEQAIYLPVNYVFEDGVEDEGWIKKAYDKARGDIRSGAKFHLGSLAFSPGKPRKDDATVIPVLQLQAADMYAYEINKIRQDDYTGRLAKVGKVRASLDNLKKDDPEMYLLTRGTIKGYFDALRDEDMRMEQQKANSLKDIEMKNDGHDQERFQAMLKTVVNVPKGKVNKHEAARPKEEKTKE